MNDNSYDFSVGKGKSRKILTSYSRDQLVSTTNVKNSNKPPEIGSGPAGDCDYTYAGIIDSSSQVLTEKIHPTQPPFIFRATICSMLFFPYISVTLKTPEF